MVHLGFSFQETIRLNCSDAIDHAYGISSAGYPAPVGYIRHIGRRIPDWLWSLYPRSRGQRGFGNGGRAVHQCASG